ncbi:MAG: DUF5043 domain-containing protein [Prevotellaceae bacterium]|jgi:hypothetical protein|nr:DUF5043 domain-containing protein [Prevotellaceae bacterium]
MKQLGLLFVLTFVTQSVFAQLSDNDYRIETTTNNSSNLSPSQTSVNYYEKPKTFYENGYTYQCDVDDAQLVTLYSKPSSLVYVDPVYKATGRLYNGEVKLFAEETWTKPLCYSIVRNAFPTAAKQRVRGVNFSIVMCINSDTGKVMEVYFQFTNYSPYTTIPVSVYRKIETEIKQKVWFTPTAEGAKLNYIMLAWRQNPEDVLHD